MPGWTYLVAVLLFGALILVHEVGHYLGGSWAGIGVAEFALGFGPRLFGFRWRGTEWNLRAFPLGGFVRWHEEGPGAFGERPAQRRAAALAAGPFANLLLTVVLLALLLGFRRGMGWQGAPEALRVVVLMVAGWFRALGSMLLHGQGLSELSGPVGIAQTTAAVALSGLDELILFAAFLSLNIGLFNLMPVPGLDGGRLVLLGLERIRGRPLSPNLEGWIHAGGFLMFMGLLILTTVRDFLT